MPNAMDRELLSCFRSTRGEQGYMVRLEAYCKQLEPLVHAVDLQRVLLHARVELEPQPLALKHEPHEP